MLVRIESAWDAVAHARGRPRALSRLQDRAGVRLDRAGMAVLRRLGTEGERLRVTELAERLDIEAPAVTRKVQVLERGGYLRRVADSSDGRAQRLVVTAAGRRALERLLAGRHGQLEEILADWSDRDCSAFASLLERFAADVAAWTRAESAS